MGVLQVFDTFYVEARDGAPSAGDIYWVPISHVDEVPRILDVKRADPHTHDEVEYEICQAQGHHFTERRERLPLKLVDLESTEELVIAKAKMRPAVVLCAHAAPDLSGASKLEQRLGASATKPSYLVAPLYSPSSPQNPGTFMPTFVARIRALRYPQLACLPQLGKNDGEPGEIVRLDRAIPSYLSRGCQRDAWKVHPDIMQMIRDQHIWAVSGAVSEYLRTVIETVGEALPTGC